MSGAHGGQLMAMPPTPPLVEREPLHPSQLLARVMQAFSRWQPLDLGTVLDDVAVALDDVPPTLEERSHLVQRLHAHLTQLANIALANGACQRDAQIARLVTRGQTLQAATSVSGTAQADLRRTGGVLSDLVDRLVAMRYVKEPDDDRLPEMERAGPVVLCQTTRLRAKPRR